MSMLSGPNGDFHRTPIPYDACSDDGSMLWCNVYDWPASLKITPRRPRPDRIGNVISLLRMSSLLPPMFCTLTGRIVNRDQRSQRIELVTANIARASDTAGEEPFVQRQFSSCPAGQIGADAERHALRQHPGSPRRALQERVEIAAVQNALDELVAAAQAAELGIQADYRAGARVDPVVHGEALDTGQYFRSLRVALVSQDLEGGQRAQAGDADAFKFVAEPRGNVLERKSGEFLETQFRERIGAVQRKPGGGLIETQQVGLVVEELEADAQRDVEKPRLDVADREILKEKSNLGIQNQRFTPAEQVRISQREVAKDARVAVHAAGQLQRGGVPFGDVYVQVDLVGLRGRLGGDADLVEESQPVQPHLGFPYRLRRIRLLLLNLHLAANYLVRGLGVAGDDDPVDQHLVPGGDVKGHVDPMRRRIEPGARIDIDERVAPVRVEIGQGQHVMLHRGALETLARLDGQQRQELAARKAEVSGDRDPAKPVRLAFIDLEQDFYRVGGPCDLRL